MNSFLTGPQLNKLGQNLALLIAIEAYGSFTGAAERLGIDQSAVSHKVRDLETNLGLRLFQRTTRRVTPTRAGRLLLNAAKRVAQDLDHTAATISNLNSETTVRLSMSSSLAMKWLLPSLGTDYFSNVDIAIDVNDSLDSLDGGGVDACIRFGAGPYPGLFAARLIQAELIPVASPMLATQFAKEQSSLATTRMNFLADSRGQVDGTGFSWENYFGARGETFTPKTLHTFDRADLMLQAAIGGAGIALGRTLLVERDIRDGLLVPVGVNVSIGSFYWIITSHELENSHSIKKLHSSLKKLVKLTTANTAATQSPQTFSAGVRGQLEPQ